MSAAVGRGGGGRLGPWEMMLLVLLLNSNEGPSCVNTAHRIRPNANPKSLQQ